MSGRRTTPAILLAATMLAGACADGGVGDAEAALAGRFLAPLTAAGVAFTVLDTCHLGPDGDGSPWHLEVRVDIAADRDAVAEVLEEEEVVLLRDRDPYLVQQEAGDPAAGWNGVLDDTAEGSSLGLTYNGVDVSGHAEAGGWLERCDATATG